MQSLYQDSNGTLSEIEKKKSKIFKQAIKKTSITKAIQRKQNQGWVGGSAGKKVCCEENMSTHMKARHDKCACRPRAAVVKQEAEAGKSPEGHGPASLAYTVVIRFSVKQGQYF